MFFDLFGLVKFKKPIKAGQTDKYIDLRLFRRQNDANI